LAIRKKQNRRDRINSKANINPLRELAKIRALVRKIARKKDIKNANIDILVEGGII
jgi:hypothetical protein